MLNGILKRKDSVRDGEANVPVTVEEPRIEFRSENDKHVLAGYIAHEFLTRGTLLGKPLGDKSASSSSSVATTPETVYNEVSNLLMRRDGGHLVDIVNPTQLFSWLQT